MKAMNGVSTRMIEVRLPKLFPLMSVHDALRVEQWYVQEGDIIQPNDRLIEVEAPPGLIDIPAPPTVTSPCRVAQIFKPQGATIRLGDLLISLEPTSDNSEEI